MTFSKVIFTLVLLITFLGASDVFANAHHHKGHEQTIASPFDKQQDEKSLHCLLNKHFHEGICPHSGLPIHNNGNMKISVECGGKDSNALPTSSFHKDNLEAPVRIARLECQSSPLIAGILLAVQQLQEVLNPPPEVL